MRCPVRSSCDNGAQIREWVVEFSADMLFISIRTDAAWYRLETCDLYPLIQLSLCKTVLCMLTEDFLALA